MNKSKSLENQASLDYKESLRNFMKRINPKPTEEQLEKLRQQYLKAREI
jgi:hypothetical protein